MTNLQSFLGIYMSDTLLLMRRFLSKEFELHLPKMRFEDWMQLSVVVQNEGITQNSFAELIVRDKTTVSRLVDGFEREGWIKRETKLEDKRSKGLYLTKKGLDLYKKGIPLIEKADEVFKKNLLESDIKELYVLLFKIQSSVSLFRS